MTLKGILAGNQRVEISKEFRGDLKRDRKEFIGDLRRTKMEV
jgi:hypothetical protein